ncbi:hypothetical protein EVA_08998 [gut metagenome]|uniref:Uncharacterized protein n=1 Tax=gut metagenome TaxID=749906 RepID=J9GRU7_9ZZZZ
MPHPARWSPFHHELHKSLHLPGSAVLPHLYLTPPQSFHCSF